MPEISIYNFYLLFISNLRLRGVKTIVGSDGVNPDNERDTDSFRKAATLFLEAN